MMKCWQQAGCEECRLNMKIIDAANDVISRQILDGMEKSGARVAIHISRNGDHLTFIAIRSADVPRILALDEGFEAKYADCLRHLKIGESLIVMTTETTDHVGIYKLPPSALN